MDIKGTSLGKFNKGLLTVLFSGVLLYLGKPFLVPIVIAAFFSMLLFPMMQRFQRKGFTASVAALVAVLSLLATLVVLGVLVNYQVQRIAKDLPQLEQRLEEKTNRLQWILYETTDIPRAEQEKIIEEKKPDIAKAAFKSVRDFLVQGLTILLFVFIVLTYTFFFLIYQQRIQNFLVWLKLFDSRKESKVVLARISHIIHDYLKGTLTVISILAIVYALGFWAIGIEHAILFAMIAALLRIIPYFGSFLGIAFPIAFAILTEDSFWQPLLVLVFFMVTQLIEANLLTPYITGSKVKLNPLATIIIILLGNLIWGIPGMVLFVPLFASLKVFFDRAPHLHPYGYILGKEEPEQVKEPTPLP